jgi:hypothetical protein
MLMTLKKELNEEGLDWHDVQTNTTSRNFKVIIEVKKLILSFSLSNGMVQRRLMVTVII